LDRDVIRHRTDRLHHLRDLQVHGTEPLLMDQCDPGELRETLVAQADRAFSSLVDQANHLLEAGMIFALRNPNIPRLQVFKVTELKSAATEIGTLVSMMGDEIARWKLGENRVLSRMGTELNVLNELYANMEALLLFYMREEIEVPQVTIDTMRTAHSELLRCNRLL
jgi:hypothetical protein